MLLVHELGFSYSLAQCRASLTELRVRRAQDTGVEVIGGATSLRRRGEWALGYSYHRKLTVAVLQPRALQPCAR